MPSQHPFGNPELLSLTLGPCTLRQAEVSSGGCRSCVAEPGRHLGCCAAPACWTLADVATILAYVPEGEPFVQRLLRTGNVIHEGLAVQPRATRDKCPFHRVRGGCGLHPTLRPLRCRMYLCNPEALMPADRLPIYQEYLADVQVLEEQLTWDLWHRGVRLGVTNLSEIRAIVQMTLGSDMVAPSARVEPVVILLGGTTD